jgi:hypothetical protein
MFTVWFYLFFCCCFGGPQLLNKKEAFVSLLEQDISDMELQLRDAPSTAQHLSVRKGMVATLRSCLTVHQMIIQSIRSVWEYVLVQSLTHSLTQSINQSLT